MKIVINIQTISDIITNSSSEVFCTITGKDVEAIYQMLKPFFPGDDSSSHTFQMFCVKLTVYHHKLLFFLLKVTTYLLFFTSSSQFPPSFSFPNNRSSTNNGLISF